MIRKLGALGASLILALSLLGFVAAAPVSATCANSILYVWGDPYYQDAGGAQGFCFANGSNDLRNVPHYNAWCQNSLGVPEATWNDCISSWQFTASSCHYGIALYRDYNYETLRWSSWNSGSYSHGTIEDMMSSIKFLYRTTCPSSPEPLAE